MKFPVIFFIFITLTWQNSHASSDILKANIQKLLRSHIKEEDASIYIKDLQSSDILYKQNESKKMILASVSKVFTAGASLYYLKKDYKFKTTLKIKGDDLLIHGGGDPFLVSEHIRMLAAQTARALKAKAITEIKGDLIGVGGFFDDIEKSEDRKSRSTSRPYNSSISDLSLNFNSLSVEVHPGKIQGDKSTVYQVPAANENITLINNSKTTTGSVSSLKIAASTNGEKYVISGNIGLNAKPEILYSAVKNPKVHFLSVFKKLLEMNGVKINGLIKSIYSKGVNTQKADSLLVYEGTPVDRAVKLLNRYSNNFMADQLLKTIAAEVSGNPGSFSNGAELVSNFLVLKGIDPKSFNISNGSGLTDDNLASSQSVVEFLEKTFSDFSDFPEILYSLTGGNIEGTGENRLSSLKKTALSPESVRFKTGTLFKKHTVSSIAGYLKTKSGRMLAFAILINKKGISNSSLISTFRTLQDKIISEVLSY